LDIEGRDVASPSDIHFSEKNDLKLQNASASTAASTESGRGLIRLRNAGFIAGRSDWVGPVIFVVGESY
jgi:hypothetical protein